MNNLDNDKIIEFVVDMAEVMLANGAEVYRVEEAMGYISQKLTGDHGENFVTPTTIICTLNNDSKTIMRRVRYRTINFERVSMINQLSRDLTFDKIELEQAIKELQIIKEKPTHSNIFYIFVAGICLGSFSLLFGGNWLDTIASVINGVILQTVLIFLDYIRLSTFVRMIIGGALVTALTLFFLTIGLGNNQDIILTSSIMLLVPGVTLTNSFRDILANDYLSGISRLMEAIFVAVCIAVGVIVVLGIFL